MRRPCRPSAEPSTDASAYRVLRSVADPVRASTASLPLTSGRSLRSVPNLRNSCARNSYRAAVVKGKPEDDCEQTKMLERSGEMDSGAELSI
ncbi:hypothetical protein GUJ93_ZPchr0002g23073 [Zizania palustris]|uniref:Uncharacterized protein n=1 Tax=Zizania palustris TaxID=103762 RepID=A0A8J5RZD1_ZIZPA|nr:hypothetical protein GUJ93_ZPchr0002g23073 [Zizania palustris]